MLFVAIIMVCVQFICIHLVIGTLTTAQFFFGILFDLLSSITPLIYMGLYTDWTDRSVQFLGQMPFLLMIFFSNAYSPGAGVYGIKELRYLFPKFYLWCMLPEDMEMEGCPEDSILRYLILSSFVFPMVFVLLGLVRALSANVHKSKKKSSQLEAIQSVEFATLQLELFGEKVLRKLKHLISSHDLAGLITTYNMTREITEDQSAAGTSAGNEDGRNDDDDGFIQSLMKLKHHLNRQDLDDLLSLYRSEREKAVYMCIDD